MKHNTVDRAAAAMLPSNIGSFCDDDFPNDGVKLGDAAFKKQSTYM